MKRNNLHVSLMPRANKTKTDKLHSAALIGENGEFVCLTKHANTG